MNKKLKQIIFPGSLSSQCNLKNPHELRFHEKINGQKQNSTTLNQMITQELLVLHGVAGVWWVSRALLGRGVRARKPKTWTWMLTSQQVELVIYALLGDHPMRLSHLSALQYNELRNQHTSQPKKKNYRRRFCIRMGFVNANITRARAATQLGNDEPGQSMTWLGEKIVHFSRQVRPFRFVSVFSYARVLISSQRLTKWL